MRQVDAEHRRVLTAIDALRSKEVRHRTAVREQLGVFRREAIRGVARSNRNLMRLDKYRPMIDAFLLATKSRLSN